MLSARNQFAGHVRSVVEGSVNGIVTLEVKGEEIMATISLEAIKALGLEAKKEATAFIEIVNVIPQPKAGGSLSTAAYVAAARTRPKLIGGERAFYAVF